MGWLTRLTTIAFFWLAFVGAILVIGLPAVKLLAGDDPDWVIGLTVPAELVDVDGAVLTRWGEARLEVEDVQGSLRLPISILPWGLFVLLWAYITLLGALMLLFLHNLRRLFQRVRDGTPFDTANARRLRRLGVIALALALLNGVIETVTSLAVRPALVSSTFSIPTGLSLDLSMVFFGLVLLALAEIFRRGTELEDEQALVI
ncbi:MAG: DUF2975 domain-containing protein [Gemmatimonadota bacterium]